MTIANILRDCCGHSFRFLLLVFLVIDIQSNIPNICKEAIDIARKRHQSGQMCPEILQLLLKGEIVLDMTIDDESVTSRYPIPLIYRPLRQFVYGVLFGASHKGEEEKSKMSETKMENQMNGDAEKSEANNNEKNQINSIREESIFKVKEWCVYGERSLDVPDFVEPKGICLLLSFYLLHCYTTIATMER